MIRNNQEKLHAAILEDPEVLRRAGEELITIQAELVLHPLFGRAAKEGEVRLSDDYPAKTEFSLVFDEGRQIDVLFLGRSPSADEKVYPIVQTQRISDTTNDGKQGVSAPRFSVWCKKAEESSANQAKTGLMSKIRAIRKATAADPSEEEAKPLTRIGEIALGWEVLLLPFSPQQAKIDGNPVPAQHLFGTDVPLVLRGITMSYLPEGATRPVQQEMGNTKPEMAAGIPDALIIK